MKKLLTFVHVFINSVSNPSYYQKLLKTRAWFSWQYFLFLNFILSFVALAHVLPGVIAFDVTPVARQTVEVFPEELVVSGDATGLHINQDLPYAIPFPQFMQDAAEQELPENTDLDINGVPYEQAADFNLITFTSDDAILNVQDFYAQQSMIVVTDTTIYMLKDAESGEVRVYGMPEFEEAFSVSRADVQRVSDKVLNHRFVAQKWYVVVIGVVSVVLALVFGTLLRIMAIAFYSIFVWLIATFFFKAQKLSYGKVFQLGLHSLTLPVLVKISIDYFMWFNFSGFWFLLVYLVWTVFLLSNIKTDQPAVVVTNIKKSSAKHSSASVKKAANGKVKTSVVKAKKTKK